MPVVIAMVASATATTIILSVAALWALSPPKKYAWSCVLVALAVLLFSWLPGMIVGGTFGGGYADILANNLGYSSRQFIPVGIGLGMTIVSSGVGLTIMAVLRLGRWFSARMGGSR